MKTTKMVRYWDRNRADFVKIPIQCSVDCNLACHECRYFDGDTEVCNGVGSRYYQKRVPFPEYVPRSTECEVRLPPDLLSFV